MLSIWPVYASVQNWKLPVCEIFFAKDRNGARRKCNFTEETNNQTNKKATKFI